MVNTSGIPAGFHTVTVSLTVKDCNAAIDFYKRALGAEELYRLEMPDGKIGHAELRIGDSIVFLGEESNMGFSRSPQTLGGTTGGINLYVSDVDAAFDRAVKAGGQAKMQVQDMFWGDRYGNFLDPFGHFWGIATRKEDLSPQEIERRAQEFFSKMKAA